jgi:hypothetical protein
MRGAIVLGAMLLVTSACTGKDPYNPGEPVGTFKVTAKLVANSCGAAPNPWEFDVRINREPGKIYWMQGGLPVEGKVSSDSRVRMETSDARVVRKSDARAGRAACQLWRDDVFDGTLGPEPLASFEGTLIYTFRAGDQSDCTDQLRAGGGQYETLPCEVRYELSAKKIADPPKR